uniref:Glycosyltransferase subfamily 4-like N-terminal domain-containing protein n=1 Tax=Pinguiococcus pyrenoidosus TaxID=172671 RepID=A0A7R9YCQ7_9STRA
MTPDLSILVVFAKLSAVCVVAAGFMLWISRKPRSTERKALICVQAFPPLLKSAGGVSKRYLTLVRALVDMGWKVTIMTPVDVARSRESDVDEWLKTGKLKHIPARGVRMKSIDGIAVFLDVFSFVNGAFLLRELVWVGGYDVLIADDIPWRFALVLICRAAGVPSVVTSHTDATQLASFKGNASLKIVWDFHMLSAQLADIHATVSRVFGDILRNRERVSVEAVWPPILWSAKFREDPAVYRDAATKVRQEWEQALGFTPKTLFLYAGRWSSEKRIHKLFPAIPKDCALVVVGDGSSAYAEKLGNEFVIPQNVLLRRRMLNATELRKSYAAADVFVSASNFETLGNTLIEAWCANTPPAVHPAQGHLEYCRDGVNGFFVDYDNPKEALAKLSRISEEALYRPEKLPKLLEQGRFFRESDFARMFMEAVVRPAVKLAERRRGYLLEIVNRGVTLLLWLALWPVFRFSLRTGFFFVSAFGPVKYEVLEKLGSSVEVQDKESGSDYEAHFSKARALGWRHGRPLPAL